MKKLIIIFTILITAISSFALPLNGQIEQFGADVAKRNKISKRAVLDWLSKADKMPEVIRYMDRQTEGKAWKEYKPLFINKKKIKKGKRFRKKFPNTLKRAYRTFGVDSYIIAAIIGVETDFGTYKLPYRAMDALSTLAFYYPRRAKYFKQELEAIMVYAYRQKMNPYNLRSSYAGAVGFPQFMPSNIRKYGVDFDKNGRVNIVKSKVDAIGSVGNYLKRHGWKKNQPIAVKVRVHGRSWQQYLNKGPKKKYSVGYLKKRGVRTSKWVHPNTKGTLVSLEGEKGTEYWLLFDNFRVIMKYNPSIKYAMAVTLLSKYLRL